jgi:membrane-bound inhibitor of C-type lysozyme
MRNRPQNLLLTGVVIAASACATNNPQPMTAQYRCADADGSDIALSVAHGIAPQSDSAVLTLRGEERILYRVRSASGARYQGGAADYWEHQQEAMVRWDDLRLTCRIATSAS